MPSAKEMKDELRKLRKEAVKPVSKMRVADVAAEIERLKAKREDTPAVASTPAEKAPKKMVAKIPDIKEAKEKEFPVAPEKDAPKKKGAAAKKEVVVGGAGAIGIAKPSKKDKLAKLLAMMESSDEE